MRCCYGINGTRLRRGRLRRDGGRLGWQGLARVRYGGFSGYCRRELGGATGVWARRVIGGLSEMWVKTLQRTSVVGRRVLWVSLGFFGFPLRGVSCDVG